MFGGVFWHEWMQLVDRFQWRSPFFLIAASIDPITRSRPTSFGASCAVSALMTPCPSQRMLGAKTHWNPLNINWKPWVWWLTYGEKKHIFVVKPKSCHKKLAVDIENMWKSKDGSVRKLHGNENSPLFASWIKRDLTLSADDFPHVRHVECWNSKISLSSSLHVYVIMTTFAHLLFGYRVFYVCGGSSMLQILKLWLW